MMMKIILSLMLSVLAVNAFSPSSSCQQRPAASLSVRFNNNVDLSSTKLNLFGMKKKEEEATTTSVVETTETSPPVAVPEMDVESAMVEKEDDEEKQDNMMQQIKSAGKAGAISLFLWELAFWAISVPVAILTFVNLNGAWPDFSNQEDLAKVGAEAFAFANVARFALPVRIGLAAATIPWVDENICQASWAPDFLKNNNNSSEE